MKKVLKLLDKIVLIPWGLTAVASATDRLSERKFMVPEKNWYLQMKKW